jgi:hypothetical protein
VGLDRRPAEAQAGIDPVHAPEGAEPLGDPGAADSVEVEEAMVAEPASAAQPGEAPEAERPTTWEEVPDVSAVESSGWIGQALGEARELSAGDVAVLAAVGVDPADGLGALRIVAGLLRLLQARHLIDLGDLSADLRAHRGPPPLAAGQDAVETTDLASSTPPDPPTEVDGVAQVPWLEQRSPDDG